MTRQSQHFEHILEFGVLTLLACITFGSFWPMLLMVFAVAVTLWAEDYILPGMFGISVLGLVAWAAGL